jgi:hypothetical protein
VLPGEGAAFTLRLLLAEGWGGWVRLLVGLLCLCERDLLACAMTGSGSCRHRL